MRNHLYHLRLLARIARKVVQHDHASVAQVLRDIAQRRAGERAVVIFHRDDAVTHGVELFGDHDAGVEGRIGIWDFRAGVVGDILDVREVLRGVHPGGFVEEDAVHVDVGIFVIDPGGVGFNIAGSGVEVARGFERVHVAEELRVIVAIELADAGDPVFVWPFSCGGSGAGVGVDDDGDGKAGVGFD